MLIQELERITGLDRPTIRYYEKEGLIAPKRTENKYRYYSDDDAETLVRIRLMRQLGVSIAKIKQLQTGAESFTDVLDAQIEALSAQIDRDTRAKYVCTAMRSDGAEYASLDARYYLKMYDQPQNEKKEPQEPFKEQVQEQIHPWRRYIARYLDYFLFGVFLDFILFVLFRIRPVFRVNNLANIFITIAYAAAFIPVETFMVHKWGTTPGKMAMGIRIERIEGGFLSLSDSWERAKQVYTSGIGLNIPILTQIAMIKNYCTLTGRSFWRWARYDSISPPYDMDWDYNNEMHYEEWGRKRCAWLISILVVGLTLMTVYINDSYKPKYRGAELTVEAFSENYNNTVNMVYKDPVDADKLNTDGTWIDTYENANIIYIGGQPDDENKSFSYECDANTGILRGVSFSQHWDDVMMLDPISDTCKVAAITLLMSQRDTNIFDLYKFMKLWDEELYNSNADFQYGKIRVQWDIELKGEFLRNGAMYVSCGESTGAEISVEFCVSILNAANG